MAAIFRLALGITLLTHVAVPTECTAQELSNVVLGDRVRIWSSELGSRSDTARVTMLTSDSLGLDLWEEPVPLISLDRLDVSRGRRSRGQGAARGAVLGMLVGGGLGFLLGSAMSLSSADECADDCGLARVLGAALGAATGPVVGVIVGAARPGEIWERVYPQRR
jgi:hypothetical protein